MRSDGAGPSAGIHAGHLRGGLLVLCPPKHDLADELIIRRDETRPHPPRPGQFLEKRRPFTDNYLVKSRVPPVGLVLCFSFKFD